MHSLRYYFWSELTSLGVDPKYVEFMIGHKRPPYHDVKMKGPEFLRNIYRAAELGIRPKTRTSRVDMFKELVRSFGLVPERVLVKDALSESRRTVPTDRIGDEPTIRSVAAALKHAFLAEIGANGSQTGVSDKNRADGVPRGDIVA